MFASRKMFKQLKCLSSNWTLIYSKVNELLETNSYEDFTDFQHSVHTKSLIKIVYKKIQRNPQWFVKVKTVIFFLFLSTLITSWFYLIVILFNTKDGNVVSTFHVYFIGMFMLMVTHANKLTR